MLLASQVRVWVAQASTHALFFNVSLLTWIRNEWRLGTRTKGIWLGLAVLKSIYRNVLTYKYQL
jgi:hypothetical protein